MALLIVVERDNSAGLPVSYGRMIFLETSLFYGVSTKSLYVRETQNGYSYLSRRGHGSHGAGDIITLERGGYTSARPGLFDALLRYGNKAKAVVYNNAIIHNAKDFDLNPLFLAVCYYFMHEKQISEVVVCKETDCDDSIYNLYTYNRDEPNNIGEYLQSIDTNTEYSPILFDR